MIDKVVDVKLGESIVAYKNVSINEEYFKGHFPYKPLVPGVLVVETMAQATGILLRKSIPEAPSMLPMVTSVKMRFLGPVFPGDRLYVTVKAVKMTKIGGVFSYEAHVDDKPIAKGEMTFACK